MIQTVMPEEFMHPADKAALDALKSVPGIDLLVKQFLKYGVERLVRGTNMASNIRLSETQLPKIYRLLPPICDKLGIDIPEFYLTMNPFPNAFTLGDSITSVTITSGLLEYMNEHEVSAVLAHECGHIVCHHMLYHTMATLLLNGVDIFSVMHGLPFARIALAPIKYALFFWYRQSELSADRAAALIAGSKTARTMLVRLAGGPLSLSKDISIEEWAHQAEEYERLKSGNTWDKALQMFAVMNKFHPFNAVRINEILQWEKTDQYAELCARISAKPYRESEEAGGKPSSEKKIKKDPLGKKPVPAAKKNTAAAKPAVFKTLGKRAAPLKKESSGQATAKTIGRRDAARKGGKTGPTKTIGRKK